MIVIPSIDIYEGQVVRLAKGDFGSVTFYKASPLEQANTYADNGFKLIHIVDLLGSKEGKFTELETVSQIKSEIDLKIQFGGGVRDYKTAEQIFSSGIDYAVVGSLSVKNKEEFESIIKKLSPGKFVIAVDAKDEKIAVSGWTEETSISVYDHIHYCQSLGIERFLCTDISKDGMLRGSNISLYEKILNEFSDIKLIASGGIKDIKEVEKLNELPLYGAVIGKAIYEKQINIEDLKKFAE